MKNDFSRYFREIQLKFPRMCARIMNESGLTYPQYLLLNELAGEGPIAMTEVGKKLYISKPAVTHLVDMLEKQKLIERRPHPKDRRVSLLQILPKGEKQIREIQNYKLDFLIKTLNKLNPRDQKTVVEFHALLSKNLDGMLEQWEEKKK